MINTKVELLPCPFCGNTELYIGANDCTSWKVGCQCGCAMIERMPNEYTKKEKKQLEEIRKEFKTNSFKAMDVLHMLSVSEKWNKRG